VALPKIKAAFIPPMLLLRAERLPDGPDWLYELKLDDYRALAIKSGGKVHCAHETTRTSTPGIPLW
jgi:ATP-dependent DNA ligase